MPPAKRAPAKTPPTPVPAAAAGAGKVPGPDDGGGVGGVPAFAMPSYALEAGRAGSGGAGRERLLGTEWLLANGLGGYAMGTASGVPSRRYHGLLVAATLPPGGRVMALNATADALVVGPEGGAERRYELSTFRFGAQGNVLHPGGLDRLTKFEVGERAAWTYDVPEAGVRVVRELSIIDGENVAQLRYRVERTGPGAGAKEAVRLVVRPLTALRDSHHLVRRSYADRFHSCGAKEGVRVAFGDEPVQLHMLSAGGRFVADVQWWYDFFYAIEASRGQDAVEDLYSPGEFRLELAAGATSAEMVVQAAVAPAAIADAGASSARRRGRVGSMYGAALSGRGKGAGAVGADDARAVARLAAAADAYVVKRRAPGAAESSGPADAAAIIAGYPWFGSWGRDTCISMFGLLLATGRHAEAGAALRLYAGHRRNGIVPNLFDDRTGEPHYNTVDASLWFVLAACRHFALTGDRASWDGTLLPACLDVVAHYRRGTDFNIAMDPMDKLVTAGTAATQLTWMDAKRNGVTFTPRHGKAVEVNALWHAALRELSLAVRETDAAMAANLGDLAEAVARSFRAAFWNGARGCLHDCLSPKEGESGWRPIDEVRPNQLLAVSLGHGLLTKEQQRGVVGTVRERLLTPMGVRTLDPADPRYRGRTEGDMMARDGAYHNGTAWPWLLGPYAEAVLRAGDFSESAKREARAALWPVVEAMGGLTGEGAGGCLGQIAEIFDAEAPQRAQGCTAQAWSVAEVLRVLLMVV